MSPGTYHYHLRSMFTASIGADILRYLYITPDIHGLCVLFNPTEGFLYIHLHWYFSTRTAPCFIAVFLSIYDVTYVSIFMIHYFYTYYHLSTRMPPSMTTIPTLSWFRVVVVSSFWLDDTTLLSYVRFAHLCHMASSRELDAGG